MIVPWQEWNKPGPTRSVTNWLNLVNPL